MAPDAPLTLELEAWRALWRSGAEVFNADAPTRLLISGDSAGANLAAALIYGVFDMRLFYGCRWDRAS